MVLVREQQGIDLRCFYLYTDICIDLYYYTGNSGIYTASPGIVSRSKQPTQTQCPETAASRKQDPREGSGGRQSQSEKASLESGLEGQQELSGAECCVCGDEGAGPWHRAPPPPRGQSSEPAGFGPS